MEKVFERRKEERTEQKGTLMVSDVTADYYIYTQLGNVSENGMYFESERSFKSGNVIKIRHNNPPFKPLPIDYYATVQWCRKLSDKDSIFSYGVGVRYF